MFALVSCLTLRAKAEEKDAATLFEEGRAAVRAGNCVRALELLTQSQQMDPAVGTALNLAICEERTSKLLAAIEHLTFIVEHAQLDDPRHAFAEKRRDELSGRLAYITVEVPFGAPDGAEFSLDGNALERDAFGQPVRVDPGLHELTFRLLGVVQVQEKLDLREGERRTWIPHVVAAAPATSTASAHPAQASHRESVPSPRPTRSTHHRPASAYVLLGAGTAALATCLVLGAVVIHKNKVVNGHCDADGGCDEVGTSAARTGKTLSTISTISGAIAVPSLALGGYLWLSYSPPADGTGSAVHVGLSVPAL